MAKILLVSKEGYGASFLLRLAMEGHSVSYFLTKKSYYDVCGGLRPCEPLLAKPQFADYDLVLFDISGQPDLAEESLKQSPTIGDGSLCTDMEDDRLFGLNLMENVGINVPPYREFNDLKEAKKFVKQTNKAYVFKPYGDQNTMSTYVSHGPEDMVNYLDKLSSETGGGEFILQEVVTGVEISTEAWFNGEEFFLVNSTLEEKKLMNDNKGPNTGCAGNVVWTYKAGTGHPLIFDRGLYRVKDFLQAYKFRGMVDLNTIVNESALYGLEWTPRFGYDAAATLFAMLTSNLGDFLGAIATGARPDYQLNNSYAAAVRLSIPPYPSEIKGEHPSDVPIEGIKEEDLSNYYLYDACLNRRGNLVTCGVSGFVAVPTATGSTLEEAFDNCYARVNQVHIPDMQYRTDLKDSTVKRYCMLDRGGWLS